MRIFSNKQLAPWLGALCAALCAKAQLADTKEAAELTIVNATCVPAISLSVNGTMCYPDFPQGAQTGNGTWDGLKNRYQAADGKSGRTSEPCSVTLTARANQTLIVAGDFSTDISPVAFPQPGPPPEPPSKPFPPNVHFLVYPYEAQADSTRPCFRFVNLMPRIPLELAQPNRPATRLLPGKDVLLTSQPRPAVYSAKAGDKTFTITLITKEDKNQLVIFFLKDGAPAWKAVAEQTAPANPPPETGDQ